MRQGAAAVRLPLALLVVASLAGATALLGLPHALGRAMDAAFSPGAHSGPLSGPFAGAFDGVTWMQLAVALLLTATVAESLIAYAGGTAAAGATATVRHLMLRHATGTGPRLTRAIPAGDLVSRASGNAAQTGAAGTHVVEGVAALIPGFGAGVMLFRIDVWCGTAFVVGLLALSALLATLVRSVTDVTEQYAVAQGDIAGRLTEALLGARTVAAAGTLATERRRVLEPVADLRRHGATLWTAQAAAVGQSAALLPLLEVVVIATAGWQLTAGRITVGDMVAASGYVGLGIGIITALTKLLSYGQSRGAARRCAAALAVTVTEYGAVETLTSRGALTLVDVRVGSGETAALRGVTLHIPAGTSVAIVGRSGSGKSTLAGLFGRIVEPDAGQVCIDGYLVQDLSPAALHTAVTYAFPRPALLGTTVEDTIAFGFHRPTHAAVVEAAQAARADAFIRRLPLGYATPLPDAPMSGGEAQRLGLARAFAHAGRVLVLDDATSSLDTVTELQVVAALHNAGSGQTRVVVAHRASTASRADHVIWLERGTVRGYAHHSVLWADPDYRAVFATSDPEPFALAGLFPAHRTASVGCEPDPVAAPDPAATPDPVAAPGTAPVPDPVAVRVGGLT
jgi:ATP-binding cassette subfamily B protein